MRKFEKGDRVAIYTTYGRKIGTVVRHESIRSIATEPKEEMVVVRHESGVEYRQHPKQLRKLKPKKKPLRTEGIVKWRIINGYAFPAGGAGATLNNGNFGDLIGKRTRITVEVIGE